MVRLRSILLAGIVAVPVMLQAADFKWTLSDRQGWWFTNEMSDVDSLDSKMYSSFTGANNNTFIGASRLGAKVQTDKYAGQVEVALRHPKNASSAVNLRQAWGSWNFSPMLGLTIGITDAPFTIKSSGQGYWEQVDQGKFSGKRSHNDKVMLYQLNIKGGPVSGKIALQNNECDLKATTVKSYKAGDVVSQTVTTVVPQSIHGTDTVKAYTTSVSNTRNEGPIPHIEFQAGYKSTMINANIVGMYQTYDHTYMTKADSIAGKGYASKIAINSFAFGADLSVKVSMFTLLAGFSYGVNNENAGINTSYSTVSCYGPVSANVGEDSVKYNASKLWASNPFSPAAVATVIQGEVKDAMSWGFPISLTAEINKKISVVAGFGICHVEEYATRTAAGTTLAQADALLKKVDQMSVYINAKIKPVSGLTLQPEVGYIDFDMNKNLGVFPQMYFGFLTQIDL